LFMFLIHLHILPCGFMVARIMLLRTILSLIHIIRTPKLLMDSQCPPRSGQYH
jgi:hypothetical protein